MPSGSRKALESGFTYIGLLIFMIISGIGLAAIGEVWHTQAQREKETELLFIGEQFRNALQNYYQQTPGVAKQFPATLDELLLDKRLRAGFIATKAFDEYRKHQPHPTPAKTQPLPPQRVPTLHVEIEKKPTPTAFGFHCTNECPKSLD